MKSLVSKAVGTVLSARRAETISWRDGSSQQQLDLGKNNCQDEFTPGTQ